MFLLRFAAPWADWEDGNMSLYTERMNRVRENLSEKGLAHTVISDLSSIYYLTGRMVYHAVSYTHLDV